MIYNIVLVCASGFSTSMLVTKMKMAAKNQQIEANIEAIDASRVDEYIHDADLFMLGPQVSHILDHLKKQMSNYGIDVVMINSVDYGMMNGSHVLNEAVQLIKNRRKL